MKTPAYKRIIEAYDTKHGAVRANLTYEMLSKIKVPLLNSMETREFMKMKSGIKDAHKQLDEKEGRMQRYVGGIVRTDRNSGQKEISNHPKRIRI